MNWASGFSQDPLYFYGGSNWTRTEDPRRPGDSVDVFSSRIRRFVVRNLFAESSYPFSRFNRIELGVHAVNIAEASLDLQTFYDANGPFDQRLVQGGGPSPPLGQPPIPQLNRNNLFAYVGPLPGPPS